MLPGCTDVQKCSPQRGHLGECWVYNASEAYVILTNRAFRPLSLVYPRHKSYLFRPRRWQVAFGFKMDLNSILLGESCFWPLIHPCFMYSKQNYWEPGLPWPEQEVITSIKALSTTNNIPFRDSRQRHQTWTYKIQMYLERSLVELNIAHHHCHYNF